MVSEPSPKKPPGEQSSQNPPKARPIFSNCLLGNSRFTSAGHEDSLGDRRDSSAPSESSCAIGASCIAQQGVASPGDGSVFMECKQGQCSCHLEALTAPHTVVDFQFTANCASPELMRQLIRDHCLAGMDVKERSDVLDDTLNGN